MSTSARRRIWSDAIREKLHVDVPLPEPPAKRIPEKHFHIWVERGWGGALSPRLGSTEEVNEELRAVLAELGDPPIQGNRSFPFTALFIMVPDSKHPGSDSGQSLNAVVHNCPSNHHTCNDTEVWR